MMNGGGWCCGGKRSAKGGEPGGAGGGLFGGVEVPWARRDAVVYLVEGCEWGGTCDSAFMRAVGFWGRNPGGSFGFRTG